MAKSDGGRIGVLAGGRRLRLGRGGSSGGAAPSVATGFHLHGHGFLTTFLHPGRIGMSTHSSPPDAKFGFKLQSTLSQPSEEKNQSGWRCQSVGSYKVLYSLYSLAKSRGLPINFSDLQDFA
ncbi:hypothetical protein GUJ93_ZPchr0007g5688 [Zizania palustris]|uniref:Uncharacterized protein n=1 Tax=Zizania palustris TaxID=103762 RepID=A0A8J5VR35_ZIZPA|nr:hypothetical protein GUJ93_ZPchr0007g5688 [Zizania palustris]